MRSCRFISGSSNDQCVLETDALFPERILLRLLSGFSYTETIQIASSPMLKDFLELLKGVSLSPVQLSLELAAVTTLVLLLIGLPLSWWLARAVGVRQSMR